VVNFNLKQINKILNNSPFKNLPFIQEEVCLRHYLQLKLIRVPQQTLPTVTIFKHLVIPIQ